MDEAALEKTAKDAVINGLTASADFPAGAGEIARQLSSQAILGGGAPLNVRAICKGVIGAALLLEKDLPLTALSILNQMSAVAHETHQDPAELMTAAMEGIAPVAKMAGEAACSSVKDSIEAAFMGAGEIFTRACETAGA